MKKGCIAVLIIVPLLCVIAVGTAGYIANQRFGLTVAPAVSHETLASAQTRLRAVLKPDKLQGFIARHLPPGAVPLPGFVPWNAEQLLPEVLPQEVAVLAGSDYAGGHVRLKLFVNERRGGPMIQQALNQSGLFAKVRQIAWDPNLVQMQQRGVLTVDGSIPIPEATETRVLEHWTHQSPGQPLTAQGYHLFEAVLDNRNGEILTLFAAISKLMDYEWQKALDQQKIIMDTLVNVRSARLDANLASDDKMLINLRIDANAEARPVFDFYANIGVMYGKGWLKNNYDMGLEGKFVWDENASAAIGNFELTGFEKHVQAYITKLAA